MILIPNKRVMKADLKKPLTHYLDRQSARGKSIADKLQKLNIFANKEKDDATTAALKTAFVNMHDRRKQVGDAADSLSAPTIARYRLIVDYYAQLHFLNGRFPIAPDGIRLEFAWFDAFAPEVYVKLPVIMWEKVSVLWNMAATQNNVGAFLDISREGGATAAAGHFALAAGIFSHIKQLSNEFKEERTRDISPQLLDLMVELCLANVQNAIYAGAIAKGMKPATLARLALATSQLYHSVFSYSKQTHARQDWKILAAIAANQFHAAAHFHQAKIEHQNAITTNKDFGIEVGRLKYAETLILQAVSQNRSLERPTKIRTAALETLMQQIVSARKEAEAKNHSIYFDLEPEPHQLAAISPLKMCKAKDFDPVKEMEGAEDLFASFVPRVVAVAVEEFDGQVQQVLNEATAEAQANSDTSRATLASLGLPASLEANNGEAGLPESVWKDVADVQTQGGGQALETGLRGNQDLNRELMTVIDRASAELSADASEELRRQKQYGAAWKRTTDTAAVSKLRDEITYYRSLLEDAAGSDNQVRSKLLTHQDDIAQLGCSRAQLDSFMPKVDEVQTVVGPEKEAVSQLVEAISGLNQSRERLVEELKSLAAGTNVKDQLLRDGAKKLSEDGKHQLEGKEELFASKLAPLQEVVGKLQQSAAAQVELLEKLTAANTAYTAKQNDNDVVKRRGQILSGVQKGVSAYRDIQQNVQQGKDFYEQFRDRAQALSARVTDYRRTRDLEAREHIAAINRPKPKTAAAPPPPYTPSPTAYNPASSPGGGWSGLPPAPASNNNQFIGGARAVALPGYNPRQQHQPAPAPATRAVAGQPVFGRPLQSSNPHSGLVRATPVVRAAPVRVQPVVSATPASTSTSGGWICKMCTFGNTKPEGLVCEMCCSKRE